MIYFTAKDILTAARRISILSTDLQMDVEDVTISNLRKNSDRNILAVYGSRFTKNAKIFVNGEKVPTNYISSALVTTSLDNVKDGDMISVNILGSKGILLRAGARRGSSMRIRDVIHETADGQLRSETTEVPSPCIHMESEHALFGKDRYEIF